MAAATFLLSQVYYLYVFLPPLSGQQIIFTSEMVKYLELNFSHINCWYKNTWGTCLRCFTFFLYIINSKKYCTFQLHVRAFCVRARTMHVLEMHLMFCYNEFWIYLHICSFCNRESTKSCLLPFLSNLHVHVYCTSIKGPTFQSSEGGRLTEVGL